MGLGSQGFGEIKEVGAGYTLLWSGRNVNKGVKQELALPLKLNLLVSFQDCQNLMALRLPLLGNKHASIVSAYALTMVNLVAVM